MQLREEPAVGDLIYCHSIGSKYGWYLNQVAIVVNYASNPTELDPSNFKYNIYLPEFRKYYDVTSKDFENGNTEIISKINGSMSTAKLKDLSQRISLYKRGKSK